MLAFSSFPVALFLLMRTTAVHGLDIVMNCETVRDGDVSTFTGTLYKENISVCTVLHPTKVIFQLKYPSTVTENLCVHPLSPCNNTVNAKGCRCVSDGADAYTFEFNFRFNKSKHEGSKLCFFSDCVGIKNLDRSDPCNLKEATTTPAPTTPALPGAAMPTTTGADDTSDSHKTCVNWIVVGVTVALWQWLLLCVLH